VTVLTAMTLLAKKGEIYVNAPDVERFLVKGGARYAGPWILFTKPRWNGWGDLANRLRAKQEHKLGIYEDFSVEDARKYHEATYSIGMGAARRFCRQVDLTGKKLLLDLGGGSGAYSIVATQSFPGLKAIVLDLPPVVEVTKEFLAQNNASDRVSTLAGDFTVTEFPKDVDVVLMASNLPQYSPELIRLVVAKAFAALKPGGEMHLVGEALNDQRTGPLSAALWGLNEAIWGSTGVAHSEADCKNYFREAGFSEIGVAEFIPGVLSRIHGKKAI